MKPDYRNWIPKGMIWSFGLTFLGLCAAVAVVVLLAEGSNRTTLQQVFRQMYGMTIYEYRTQVRMQEAKNLLLREGLSVTEIAGLCGYSNASKFAACFRRVTGTAPGEWRRKGQ